MEISAKIIPFPVDRDMYFIRVTARQLNRRNGEQANRFFRTECNRLYARLQNQGLERAAIEAEIDRFAKAVRHELERLNSFGRHHPGGDAA